MKLHDAMATHVMPREKLIAGSASDLSIAELLAIIFSTGFKKINVVELAESLMKEYGQSGLRDVHSVQEVQETTGLPPVKSCQLVAVMELGRRLFDDRNKHVSQRAIHSPNDVFERVSDMRDLRKEQLRGLYLNVRNHVIHEETISIGTTTANLVSPADVFRPALQYAAVGIIIVHNHPSGDPTPSDEDISITSKLVEAGNLLTVKLLDHVIVAKNDFISLSDYGVV
jgi:DNA repair protein RadC